MLSFKVFPRDSAPELVQAGIIHAQFFGEVGDEGSGAESAECVGRGYFGELGLMIQLASDSTVNCFIGRILGSGTGLDMEPVDTAQMPIAAQVPRLKVGWDSPVDKFPYTAMSTDQLASFGIYYETVAPIIESERPSCTFGAGVSQNELVHPSLDFASPGNSHSPILQEATYNV